MQKVQKRQLKNRCTFYYNHLDLNDNKKSKDKEKEDDKEEKDNYKKLIKSHLEKKGKKKYWSNISRNIDTDNDLI